MKNLFKTLFVIALVNAITVVMLSSCTMQPHKDFGSSKFVYKKQNKNVSSRLNDCDKLFR